MIPIGSGRQMPISLGMSPKRIWHLSTCTTLAILLTIGAVALDWQRSGVQQATSGLSLARQVASQAEGMTLRAREIGEKDPVAWAVNYLAQGVEPRVVRISRARLHDSSAENTENYSLDRDTGSFEYTRFFTTENGTGVRILLSLGYVGFLGTKSPLANDSMAFIFFLITFGILFLRTGRYFGFNDTYPLRVLVSDWVRGSKAQLTRLGVHIREMVRQSQRLAASSGRSRQLVGELRGKIHEGINELHGSRQFYQEGESIAARAEGLALNAAIEANRLGGDARRIADMATELHRCIQQLRTVNRKGQALVQRVEKQIEPWATDSDLAFHAFDDVKEATETLSRHIRSTTETLVGQAKLIRDLHQELGTGEDMSSPASAPESLPAPRDEDEPVEPTITASNVQRLPDPLPPIEEREKKPLLRKIRFKKPA
jgi:hypothetical protein